MMTTGAEPSTLDEVHDVVRVALGRLPASGLISGIDIRPNAYESRSRSWLITVNMVGSTSLELFCKAGPGSTRNAVGDPSGIDYEAHVYEQIIGLWGVPSPTFYGRIQGERSGWSYLLIGSLIGFQRINKAPQPDSILAAARGLGAAHRRAAEGTQLWPGLNRYDVPMFKRWMKNALAFHPIVGAAGDARCEFVFNEMAAAEPTLVHGDCYPENVLIRGSKIQTIDWEWAGWGAGEIDLAALTEGWEDDIVRACTDTYTAARWPTGAPYDVALMVTRARLYLTARWLGGRPDRGDDPHAAVHLEAMEATLAAIGASR